MSKKEKDDHKTLLLQRQRSTYIFSSQHYHEAMSQSKKSRETKMGMHILDQAFGILRLFWSKRLKEGILLI